MHFQWLIRHHVDDRDVHDRQYDLHRQFGHDHCQVVGTNSEPAIEMLTFQQLHLRWNYERMKCIWSVVNEWLDLNSEWEQTYIVIILASVDCTWRLWWRWNRIRNWRVLSMHRCLCLGKYHQQQDPRKMSYKFAISCNSGNENRSISFCRLSRDWHICHEITESLHICVVRRL